MKKFFILLLTLTLLCSTAIADEILFRGIPWGSNANEVASTMDNIGFKTDLEDYCIPYFDTYDADPGTLPLLSGSDYPSGSVTYYYVNSEKVAGYPIQAVTMRFVYSLSDGAVLKSVEDSKLYMAEYSLEVMDIDGAYTDLKSKLTNLYGECVEETSNGRGSQYSPNAKGEYETHEYNWVKRTCVWQGDDGTSVRLYSSMSDLGVIEDWTNNYIVIAYGTTEYDALIQEVSDAVKIELLKNEAESRTGNMDGL